MSTASITPHDEFDAISASLLTNPLYREVQRDICGVILGALRPVFVGELTHNSKTSPSILIRNPRNAGMTTVYLHIIAALLKSSRSLEMIYVCQGVSSRRDFQADLSTLVGMLFEENNTLQLNGSNLRCITVVEGCMGLRGCNPQIIFFDHYQYGEIVGILFVPLLFAKPNPTFILSSSDEHGDGDAFVRTATKHDFGQTIQEAEVQPVQ